VWPSAGEWRRKTAAAVGAFSEEFSSVRKQLSSPGQDSDQLHCDTHHHNHHANRPTTMAQNACTKFTDNYELKEELGK
jgi:hypothetical protein